MAISGGDGSIILTTKVDETGLKKGLGSMGKTAKSFGAGVAKSFAVIGAAAATATVAITKMATSAYADYEQLVGGVETLFKGSADKVMAYAENAFYTAGVSANEYMKQVTSFSASLIRSTAGDTDKAADIANMALVDISDNVNKMGSSMESVQLAYQGFARQQYLLLDNLKLGYGGTKTEMERLLKDAQALTGVKYDINNLADVYSAIHAIQEELGITGTTAKEAEKTITGSANMMKAAWQNVLSAIAGGGDLDKSINNLVYSIQKYFENIVPVVERSLQGIGQLIERVAPMLVQTVARALIKAIPSLLNAVYQMIISLAKGIYQGIVDLFSGGAEKALQAQTNEIAQSVENQNALTEAVEETAKAQKGALAGFDEINTLTQSSTNNMDDEGLAVSGAISNLNTAELKNGENAISGFFDTLLNSLTEIDFKKLKKSLVGILNPIQKLEKVSWGILSDGFNKFLKPISEFVIEDALPRYLDTLSVAVDALSVVLDKSWDILMQFVDEFLNPIWEYAKPKLLEIWDDFNKKLQEFVSLVEKSEIWGDLKTILSAIYDVLTPIAEKIIDFVTPIINFKINAAFSDLEYLFKSLEDAIGAIADLINGDFDNAWQHLKELFLDNFIDTSKEKFKNFSDTLKEITGLDATEWINEYISNFESGINKIIKAFETMINWIIGGLNKISFEIPDWLGGGTFGINISKVKFNKVSIPRLAQGAVVPPNREFMAVLGDNKKETEIVSPLSTMKQAFIEAMMSVNTNQSQDNRPIILQVDSREIARATRTGEEKLGAQTVFGGFANAY